MIDKFTLKQDDVLVIDYGVGNHLSILNALDFLGYKFSISCKSEDIKNAKSYILPGVGAFYEAMRNLEHLKIIDILNKQVLINKKPILGICLGMQIMADDSEEKGKHNGLGWIKGNVIRIKESKTLCVPHVGWNDLKVIKREPLFLRNYDAPHFYFDHSYHYICDKKYLVAQCQFGEYITAVIQKDNIFGVQFHPEKSQNNGLKLFRSFFNYIEDYYKNQEEKC